MDYYAKRAIWDVTNLDNMNTAQFPWKAVCVKIGRNKITSDRVDELKFWVHHKIARETFHQLRLLNTIKFNLVDWEMVDIALRRVPRMFQIWACKQVTNLAPANGNKPWDRSNETCPSCQQAKETTSHILL